MRPLSSQLDLLLQEISEVDARRAQLLRQKGRARQPRQRVQLQKIDVLIIGCNDIGARISLTSERRVCGEADILRAFAHQIGNMRRTDLARAAAEVFAGVVEGVAGIDFDFENRQREWSVTVVNDAYRQLAAGDELLGEIRNVRTDLKSVSTPDEE